MNTCQTKAHTEQRISPGGKLRLIRKSRGLSTATVSGLTGFSTQRILQIETFGTIPTVPTIRRLSIALQLTKEEVFDIVMNTIL